MHGVYAVGHGAAYGFQGGGVAVEKISFHVVGPLKEKPGAGGDCSGGGGKNQNESCGGLDRVALALLFLFHCRGFVARTLGGAVGLKCFGVAAHLKKPVGFAGESVGVLLFGLVHGAVFLWV
jgi:hypothetical protein